MSFCISDVICGSAHWSVMPLGILGIVYIAPDPSWATEHLARPASQPARGAHHINWPDLS